MQGSGSNKKAGNNSRTGELPTSTSEIQMGTMERGSKSSTSSSLRRPTRLDTLDLYEHDLPDDAYYKLAKEPSLAIDTETGGLDYRTARLALVQLATRDNKVFMVRRPDYKSTKLINLLTSLQIKIFHHCLFDLRFIKANMYIEPSHHIECTKTMMKVVHPDLGSGLAASLRNMLDVKIDKTAQLTDWFSNELTDEQLWYAANDVLYLHDLKDKIYRDARPHHPNRYAKALKAIMNKAYLDVEGYTSLLDYPQEDPQTVLANRNWWLKLQAERED